MSEPAIRIEGLGKRYRIGARQQPYATLRDALANAASKNLRRLWSRNGAEDGGGSAIWALRDVSFEVRQGEVVGIIGRNGAGKSTLLKILCRITEPTEGFAEVEGRIGSLLEVGTGFHPELTGRENVYLNGAILGMTRGEIGRRFDEIIAFAGVERFVDTPLKHYSSGMYLRLAFAVAAHLQSDILLVDEVLAVGDLEFQKKCLAKMGEVARTGRTVLFVSHNMGAIQRLCGRAVWLEGGRVAHQGGTAETVQRYQARFLQPNAVWRAPQGEDPGREFQFLSVELEQSGRPSGGVFSGDEPVAVQIRFAVRRHLTACALSARIYNQDGVAVFTTADGDSAHVSALPKSPGVYRTAFVIPGRFLAPGGYYIYLAAHMPGRCFFDLIEQAVTFEVAGGGSLQSLDGRHGVVTPLLEWATVADPAARERSG